MIDTDCEIVAVPYPPESRTIDSPPGSVCVIAVPKLRHGDAIEHGLPSDPPVETNVRCAASAGAAISEIATIDKIDECVTGAPYFNGFAVSAPPTSAAPRPVSALFPDVRNSPADAWFKSVDPLLASIEFDTTPTALSPLTLKPKLLLSSEADSDNANTIVPVPAFEFAA